MRSFKVNQYLMYSKDHFTRLLYLGQHHIIGCCKMDDCEPCSGLTRVSDLSVRQVLPLISTGFL